MALAWVAAAACTAAPPVRPEHALPFKVIEPLVALRAETVGGGLAERIRVTVSIEPAGALPLTVEAQRAPGERGDDALVDLAVSWRDFRGDAPVASGRSVHALQPFGAGGAAAPGAPLVRTFEVGLEPPRDDLARRVHVTGRIYVLDLHDAEGRTGSVAVPLPATVVESRAREPRTGWRGALAGDDPAELFLAVAASAPAERRAVVGALVGALPRLDGAMESAAFAGLLYLTDETHGRSEYRWTTWWREQQTRRAGP